jgi:hypothetical protein
MAFIKSLVGHMKYISEKNNLFTQARAGLGGGFHASVSMILF